MPDALLTAALLGTSTAPLPPAEHPADEIVSASDRKLTPEETVLLRAAARAAYDAAGVKPGPSLQVASECPPETQLVGSLDLMRSLEAADAANEYRQHPSPLIVALRRQMANAGVLLPPELLPRLLAKTPEAYRADLRPLLGVRGRYLAELNPKWSWAVDDFAGESINVAAARETFATSSIDEQLAMLEAVRSLDPAAGREMLEEVFPTEQAKNRVRLLWRLKPQLEPDDESLLASALGDRSGGVRQTASEYLAQLSTSEFARRMRQRAEAMLSFQTPGRIRNRSGLVTCDPPDPLPDEPLEDGISSVERTLISKSDAFIIGTLRMVPPSVWGERFESSPAELFRAASGMFESAIATGWAEAAALHDDGDWMRAAVLHLKKTEPGGRGTAIRKQRLTRIVQALSQEDREQLILDTIDTNPDFCDDMVREFYGEGAWSDRFLTQILEWLPGQVARGRGETPRGTFWLAFASKVLPGLPIANLPQDLNELRTAVETNSGDRSVYDVEHLASLEDQFRLRHRFQAELDRIVASV